MVSHPAATPRFSIEARAALGRLQAQNERSHNSRDALRKAMAAQELEQALGALGLRLGSIITLWAIRHRSIADIAIASKKSEAEIGGLLAEAAEALVRHYEADGG